MTVDSTTLARIHANLMRIVHERQALYQQTKTLLREIDRKEELKK